MEETEVIREEIPKEEVKTPSLQERLSQATERKPEPKNIKVDTSYFGSDDDFAPETKEEKKEAVKSEDKKIDSEKTATTAITEKAKRSSASVAVGMIDMTLQSFLTPIHGWKFKRKFKKEVVKKLEEYIDDTDIEALEAEEDKKLKRKWDRLFKKYETKKNAIALDEKEKTDLSEAFYLYFNFKEKTLPPEWFVGMAITNAVGKRAIDLLND